jgi:hypothetical protein
MSTIGIWNTIHHSVTQRTQNSSTSKTNSKTSTGSSYENTTFTELRKKYNLDKVDEEKEKEDDEFEM